MPRREKAAEIYFTKRGKFAKKEIFSINLLFKISNNYLGLAAKIRRTILFSSLNLHKSAAKVIIVRKDDSGSSSSSRHIPYPSAREKTFMKLESIPTRGRTLDYAACVYDILEPLCLLNRQAEFDAALLASLSPRPADTILDVGCGTGLLCHKIAQLLDPAVQPIGAHKVLSLRHRFPPVVNRLF